MIEIPKGYTPGPLVVSASGINEWTVERRSGEIRSVLCRLRDSELCPEHGGSVKANAELYAQAPHPRRRGRAVEGGTAVVSPAGHRRPLYSVRQVDHRQGFGPRRS